MTGVNVDQRDQWVREDRQGLQVPPEIWVHQDHRDCQDWKDVLALRVLRGLQDHRDHRDQRILAPTWSSTTIMGSQDCQVLPDRTDLLDCQGKEVLMESEVLVGLLE